LWRNDLLILEANNAMLPISNFIQRINILCAPDGRSSAIFLADCLCVTIIESAGFVAIYLLKKGKGGEPQ
jgi:hypothetical protein